MFRGALIGVVQGCVYLAVTNEALDKRHELEAVVSLMFLNFFLFTMLGGISATIADSVIVSEAHWQKTAANREFMWKALYISSLTFKIPDDAAPRLVIAVRIIQFVVFPTIVASVFGISLPDVIKWLLHLRPA
jgi:hypothetical protein